MRMEDGEDERVGERKGRGEVYEMERRVGLVTLGILGRKEETTKDTMKGRKTEGRHKNLS